MEKMMNGTHCKKRLPLRLTTPLLLLLSLHSLILKADATGTNMIDFTQASEHQNWTVTNDNVMGGISTGELIYLDNMSRFRGELSLENNGGFSSIKRSIESPAYEIDSAELIFVGDGRTYQLRFTTSKDGHRVQYKHDFDTIKGEQFSKVFHFHDFQAVFRGRLLSDAPELKAQDIKQIGFLIADKQPSPFELDLIQFHFKTSQPITSPEAD
ncbi:MULTISPECIES: CIA30 family protein [Vibrio]|uniref:CIA30 family protein n=1 Tax=Vibrio TaxID=662 RepID=UPI000C83F451|nr:MULTISPECIES: CIA30 family protein [Vibrio]PMI24950.1 exonuclease [Vibrio sp. 10N.286.46.E10]PMI97210.1 exonuclease [Vibrio sp. 10N.286.45.E10]PTO98168.1 CIA30 family protein [Vibrio sp. 10N.286.48.B8]PTP10564.1 CIA30 family protein [Vibrio sp. 10N.286.45.A3]PTP17187.1 CIA30 family protein [Vibrio sp. 10N.286.51.C3]